MYDFDADVRRMLLAFRRSQNSGSMESVRAVLVVTMPTAGCVSWDPPILDRMMVLMSSTSSSPAFTGSELVWTARPVASEEQ